MATCGNIEELREDWILTAFSNEKLCSLCRKKILADTCVSILPTDPRSQLVEDSHPIQADEDPSSTVVVSATKFQYVITSDEVPESEQPQQCTEHLIVHSDDLPSISQLSTALKVDSESDSLEDKFCQLLVMGSPEIVKLEKKLEEQRLVQQIEIEIKEFNLKYEEFQRDFRKMQPLGINS